MQYKRLSLSERAMHSWRKRRNRLVQKLLDESPCLSRADALREANRLLRDKAPKLTRNAT